MQNAIRLRLLRLMLLLSGCTWGASIFGVFLPWSDLLSLLQGLGLKEFSYDPMLEYWVRMAAGAFTLLGMIFLEFGRNPQRYQAVLPLFAFLMVGEGFVLLVHGVRLHLPPLPFVADVAACLTGGIGIFLFSPAASDPDRFKNTSEK